MHLQTRGPRSVSATDRRIVLLDPSALTALHKFAWISTKKRSR